MLRTLLSLPLRVARLPLRVVRRAVREVKGVIAPAPPPPPAPVRFDPPPIDRRPPPPVPKFDAAEPDVELEPEVVIDRIRAGDPVQLVDVREPEELRRSGTPEGALHIPLGDLDRRSVELPRDAKIVLLCAAGMRSFDGARHLREHGFADAWSVTGGLPAWIRAGGKVVEQ